MPAAEQELPNPLQRFEHEQRYPSVHEQGDDQDRSVLAIPTNTLQEPKINIAGTHNLLLLLSEARNRGVGAKLFTSRVSVLPPKMWRSTLE